MNPSADTSGRARSLTRLVGGHRRGVLATAVLGATASVAGVGLIAFSARLISRSAIIDTTATVALLIVAVRFFAVTRVVARYAERSVGHLVTFRLLSRVRVWFFAAVLPVAPGGLIDRRTGELLGSIIDDVDTMQQHFLRVLVPPIVAATTIAVASAVEGASSPAAAAALCLCAVGAGLAVPAIVRRRTKGSDALISDQRAEAAATIHETLTARREVLALGAEEGTRQAILELDHSQSAARRRLANADALATAAIAMLTGGAAVLVLSIAIPMVRSGQLDGQMLAVLPLVALTCFEVIGPLTNVVGARDRSDRAADRLLSVTELPPAVTEPTHDTGRHPRLDRTPSLQFRDVTYGHDEHELVTDLSFEAPPGSHVTITGASGAGKSTLLALLLRFEEYRGSIRVDDMELTDIPSVESRRLFAAVLQHDHVFDSTIRDNLLLADPDADDDSMIEALTVAGLGPFVEQSGDALAVRTGTDGERLSGGERQRVLLARALLADRPVLLLDEAFEHLEPELADRTRRAILAATVGRTTILIDHDPAAEVTDALRVSVSLTDRTTAGSSGTIRPEASPLA